MFKKIMMVVVMAGLLSFTGMNAVSAADTATPSDMQKQIMTLKQQYRNLPSRCVK